MPSVDVRNEAGPRFDPLAARLDALAVETLPLVEAVTGLPLPDPVVIRTMTVRDWKREHRRSAKRQLHSETVELDVPLKALRQAGIQSAGRQRFRKRFWPTIGGQAVLFEPGRPELVLLPKALRHGGRLDDTAFLYKALGHEMTHLAQYAASDGAIWAAQDTFYPAQRGIADRDYGFLLEGHAYWADQQITTKILGAPVSTDEASPHSSRRYRKLAASPHRHAAVEQFRRACDTVSQIINSHGLDVFNQVWHRPDLVPTQKETSDDVAAWQARFSALKTQ
ncbi:hypothetical protein QFZ22_000466 [Streptomyces canus]|uniref:Uncharacterized protein n=1 Tax=Streptomyces canus TaxID=58343 RepID=A0AAW8F5G3_9ACTN|nr:hypothetical protein [Streptomyces canus]MDQ0904481.1 hypothetical protein [Streptomyces canus]